MFEPQSGETKDCQTGILCFSTEHAELRSWSKDWLASLGIRTTCPSRTTCLPED